MLKTQKVKKTNTEFSPVIDEDLTTIVDVYMGNFDLNCNIHLHFVYFIIPLFNGDRSFEMAKNTNSINKI